MSKLDITSIYLLCWNKKNNYMIYFYLLTPCPCKNMNVAALLQPCLKRVPHPSLIVFQQTTKTQKHH